MGRAGVEPTVTAEEGAAETAIVDSASAASTTDRLASPARVVVTTLAPEGAEAYAIPDTDLFIAEDGALHSRGSVVGGPLAMLNTLALGAGDSANPFAGVDDVALLSKVVGKLAQTHGGLIAEAPDVGTRLGWRQARAATLNLMECAALRAHALGGAVASAPSVEELVNAAVREPYRMVRDFTYESLVARAEAGTLPEVAAARESIYPARPPYEKWLENGQIDIVLYCDNDGAKVDDEVALLTRYHGFSDTKNDDGSHTLKLAGRGGLPPVVVTIPAVPDESPALFEHMDKKNVDVIAYAGHAGYGHRVDHALRNGVGGSGDGKAVVMFQCWGQGNVAELERSYPDAQVFSTTDTTHGGFDQMMWSTLIRGWRAGDGWDDMLNRGIEEIKYRWSYRSEYKDKDWQAHYFAPTTRSVLVHNVDRDGDGVSDTQDHVFNVIYPKHVDAAGGYDPVVQPIPIYALDGTQLGKSVGDLSLAIRYTHMLAPELEAKLPWNPELWRPGGFFEPEADDLRAFQFTRTPDGGVDVALSARFSHTEQEDLSRMMAYEAGLWLGAEAELGDPGRVALGLALAERVLHAQGAWYAEDGLLDEAWAEEVLFADRYGLSGMSFRALADAAGHPEEFGPVHFERVRAWTASLPGVDGLAERMPTRIGRAIEVPEDGSLKLPVSEWGAIDEAKLGGLLSQLGVDGEAGSIRPAHLFENQPTNFVLACEDARGPFQVAIGVGSDAQVHAVSVLRLDLSRMAEDVCAQALAELGESTEEDVRPDARAIFDGYRAQGNEPLEALRKTITDLRPKLPMGRHQVRALGRLDDLVTYGAASRAEIKAVSEAFDNLFGEAGAENVLSQWLEGVVPDATERIRLHTLYGRELVAQGGGTAGRLAATKALLEVLPDGLGLGGQKLLELTRVLDPNVVGAGPEVKDLQALLWRRLGVDKPERAAAVVEKLFPWVNTGAGRLQVQSCVEAVRDGVAAGRPVVDVLEAALAQASEAVRQQGQLHTSDAWVGLGLVESGSAEQARLQNVFSRASSQAIAANRLIDELVRTSAMPQAEVSALWDRCFASSGGDVTGTVRAVLASLPVLHGRELPVAVGGCLRLLQPAQRAGAASRWAETVGLTLPGALRQRLDQVAGANNPERQEVAMAAFDASLSRGASLAKSIVAWAYSLGLPAAGLAGVLDFYADAGVMSQANMARVIAQMGGGATPLALLEEVLGYLPERLADEYRDRVVAGVEPALSLLQLLEALPATDVVATFGESEVLRDFAALFSSGLIPAGASGLRDRLVAALGEKTGLSPQALAFGLSIETWDRPEYEAAAATYEGAMAEGVTVAEALERVALIGGVHVDPHALAGSGLVGRVASQRIAMAAGVASGGLGQDMGHWLARISSDRILAEEVNAEVAAMAADGSLSPQILIEGVVARLAAGRPFSDAFDIGVLSLVPVLGAMAESERLRAIEQLCTGLGTSPAQFAAQYLVTVRWSDETGLSPEEVSRRVEALFASGDDVADGLVAQGEEWHKPLERSHVAGLVGLGVLTESDGVRLLTGLGY